MKIKINALKDVMRKATLNYIIPSFQLKFKNKKMISNMVSSSMDAVVMLTLNNDVIDILPSEELDFNFSEPNSNVKPYLDLVDEDMADIIISEDNIKITTDKKQKLVFHFASPDFVSSYNGDQPPIDKWFFDQKLDDDLMVKFNKIKKIAGKFGKIYLICEDKKLYLEATDRQNKFANSMKYELGPVNEKDFELCFNFNNINALLTLIKNNYTDFEVKFHYRDDGKGGMILFKHILDSEYYYFVSKNE